MTEIMADPENRDFLLACQEWQRYIGHQATPAERDTVVAAARKDLMAQDFHGTRKVIVGGETAFYLPDGSSAEESVWPIMQFRAITTRGWLGRLEYIDMGKNGFLSWPIYTPNVLGPVHEDFVEISEPPDEMTEEDYALYSLPIDTAMDRTLHFPVNMINYALCWEQ